MGQEVCGSSPGRTYFLHPNLLKWCKKCLTDSWGKQGKSFWKAGLLCKVKRGGLQCCTYFQQPCCWLNLFVIWFDCLLTDQRVQALVEFLVFSTSEFTFTNFKSYADHQPNKFGMTSLTHFIHTDFFHDCQTITPCKNDITQSKKYCNVTLTRPVNWTS